MAQNYIDKLKTVQGILDEHGISVGELDETILNAEQYPSNEVVDEYNARVEEYRTSTGMRDWIEKGESLLEYYNQNQEVLQDDEREQTFSKLEVLLDDFTQVVALMDEARADIEREE